MVSIVAAVDEKRGIGKGNDLLFHISEDFDRMKKLTMGHPLIMGRKTFESIGRKLPGRTSIVITSNPEKLDNLNYEADVICSSLEEAIKIAQGKPGGEEIIIFGGGQILNEAVEKGLVDVLHITEVEGDYGADTFFPDYSKFKVVSEESHESEGYKYKFLELQKPQS